MAEGGFRQGGGGLTWYYDTLSPGIATFPPKMKAAISAALAYMAPQVEGYMRSNAPWTDRTSNARQGLFARPFGESGQQSVSTGGGTGRYGGAGTIGMGSSSVLSEMLGIDLYHTMPYGIWLEVRWNGKYAIILPTIRAMGPEVMSTLRNLIPRIPV